MHIEPGYVSTAKIAAANIAATGLLASHALPLLRQPQLILRSLLAALFFSVFMQSFHLAVGPSELHFIGAMPMYLILGFVPTLLGFGIGLALQGLVFEPADLVHLGINTLSLAVPLMLVHHTVGKRFDSLRLRNIMKLDAVFYTGVTAMVGFWLAIGEVATPLADWAAFAIAYAPLVVLEPLITFSLIRLLQPYAASPAMKLCTTLRAG